MAGGNGIYEQIVKNTSDGVILAKDRIIVFANQAAADIHGSGDPDEMLGSNLLDYIAESDHGKVDELEKIPFDSDWFKTPFQIGGVHKTGKPAVYEVSASGVFYEGEEVTLLLIRDITTRVKRESMISALHNSTAGLGGATSQEAMAAIILDALKEILGMDYASVSFVEEDYLVFKQHLGVSTVDRLPLSDGGLTVRAIIEATTQIINDLRENPDYIRSRPEGVAPSLSELDVPVIIDGRAVAVINIEEQETDAFSEEDVQMVEILADHFASSLERLMQERTMRALREAHLMDLVGGIDKIHENIQNNLKGPIQSLRNASFVLRHNPDLASEVVDNIDDSIERIMITLEEMKEITNPSEPEKTLTDVYGIINGAIEMSHIPDDINLENGMEGGFLALSIDSEKIKRSFYNIIRNSVEATPEGGTITIKLDSIDGFVEISITDTGSGIPEEIRDQLFQPFFSTKSSSLGLGLSFCKLAVESNGGSIAIDSVVGKGTTVSVKLPL